MDRKSNILRSALAKLSLMQRHLTEESQVLGRLKEQEETDERELEILRAELKARATALQPLKEELEKIRSENTGLHAQLDACRMKITELEMFSTSAASALKETREELDNLRNRMKNISLQLSK